MGHLSPNQKLFRIWSILKLGSQSQLSSPRKGASLDPQFQGCNKLIAICEGNKTLLWIKGRKFLHSCPISIMLRRCINMMHIAWTCVDAAEVFNHVVKI